VARWRFPTTCSSFSAAKNEAIASLPTGMTSSGASSASSASSQGAQFAISSRFGTRSPPRGSLPGKQRHTAAMYTRLRNASSSSPIPANQPNIVLPAVQANGLWIKSSFAPGAWPISMTGLGVGAPITGAPCI